MLFDSSARRRPMPVREIRSRHKRLARPAATPRPDTAESGPALFSASPSGGEGLNSWRRATAAIAGVALAFSLASCSSDDDKPTPTPSTTQATTPATSAAPSWEDAYTPEQLAAYKEALARYTAYLNKSQPIWAAGKATPAAKKLFQEYYIPWQAYLRQLEQFEQSNIRIARNADVLDSQATRISLDGGEAVVTIRQCVDATGIGATQNDKPLANAYDTPQLTDVEMAQVDGRWYITQLPTEPKDRPCGA
jgi:hypothetical protein